MKSKSLLAIALALATIGLSFPAIAGDRDGGDNRRSDRKERRENRDNRDNRRQSYYGKYHYYKLSDGSHIYIGSKGDYWDQRGNYYPDTDNNDYEKYHDTGYDYSKGDYYESGKYYSKKQLRNNRSQSYYGKYHYHKLSDGSHIYIGSKGDYWDQRGNYYPDTDNNDYEKYHDTGYDYSKGDYYESGKYYSKK